MIERNTCSCGLHVYRFRERQWFALGPTGLTPLAGAPPCALGAVLEDKRLKDGGGTR